MKVICTYLMFISLFLCNTQLLTAQNVGLYYNANYVQIDEGNLFAEGSNLKAAINTLPYGMTDFNDFKIGSLTSVLGNSDLLLIPELERGNVLETMNDESKKVLRNYVQNGGGLIICGVVAPNVENTKNGIKFLNDIFSFNLESDHFALSGMSVKNVDNVKNTHFEGLDIDLNNNNSTSFISRGLPAGSIELFSNKDALTETSVALLPFGKGKIIYLGWGWWNAKPVGSQDGGWMKVLDASILEVACVGPDAVVKPELTIQLNASGYATVDAASLDDGSVLCSGIAMFELSTSVFTCDHIGENEVDFIVTDAQGRQSSVKTIIHVEDEFSACVAKVRDIAGRCTTPDDLYIDNVEISLFENGEIKTEMTDAGGFGFEALLADVDYQLFPKKDDNYLNGITTYDLVLLTNYILTGESLSPFGIIAADVDHSGDLNINDIIEIRKLILGQIDAFEAVSSWRFIPKGYEYQLAKILETKGDDVYSFNEFQQNNLIEFFGIKMGDVSGSAVANANQSEDRGAEHISMLVMENKSLNEDEITTVDFYPGDFDQLLGFQLGLDFNSEALDILKISGGQIELNTTNVNILNDEVRISFTSNELRTLNKEEPLFSIEIQAKKRINTGSNILIASHSIESELYNGSDDVSSIGIELSEDEQVEILETSKVIYQNFPNPFTAYTEITFYTPDNEYVELYIYDEKGQFLFGKKGDFEKGENTVYISGDKFSIDGVYFYKIIIGDFSQTHKMIRM